MIHENYLKRIKQLRLIDDDFMSMVFDNNIEATQLMINIILQRADIRVKSVKAQYEVKSVEGHSVKFDIFAVDDTGKPYDIEIQRSDKGAVPQRARYNSALLDANSLNKSEQYANFKDTYIIFITENDVLKGGLPLYHIERKIEELNNDSFNDGSHIIFVNGAYRANDDIGKLMYDFHCTDSDDMNFDVLSKKVSYFKETKGGHANMCRIFEEIQDERAIEIAKKLLIKGDTIEEVSECTGLPIETIKRLVSELSNNK